MDEKDDLEPEKQIVGQMCYDEIEIQKQVEDDLLNGKNKTISGQMSYDEIQKQIESDVEKSLSSNVKARKKDEVNIEESKNNGPAIIKAERDNNKKMEVIDGIVTKSIDDVLHDSMIPYTEHVVMDRALPRVEDGLKPGQRRILYSMLELGLAPDKPFRKSARIVGDCMGKYHPHGDSSVYDAMVRMSQNFSLREPLVEGHGNFGSMDGDGAAAMRYTEARLTPLAMELLKDLDKNTVHFSYNFDDTLKEPDILPGKFPNLLINGASGIAVGVATNIPPHNLSEVIDGVVAYIDNPKMVLTDLMKYIKAPDFPTGGIIHVGEELMQAYRTGKGKITIRANTHFENEGEKQNIVITELPYQVNKAALLQKIAELKDIEKERLAAISDIRDESDRNGIRAVIKIKKEGNAKAILDYLFKQTNLQLSFGINMVAIAGGKPRQMGLLDIISYYVEYQRQVIFKRTKFELDEAKDRCHIVEGLLIAIKNIDEVVRIIKKSENVTIAKQNLRAKFTLSEKQAQAILDMRLARLVNLEITKLEQELIELQDKIKKLTLIYNSKERQLKVVKTEILEIRKQFGNPRRSKIVGVQDIEEETESIEDVLVKDVFVAQTADGKLKKISLKNYNLSQKNITENTDKSDIHTNVFACKTNDNIIAFTDEGNVLKIIVDQIPDTKWHASGISLNEINRSVHPDEKVVSVMMEGDNESKLYFYTQKGMIKCSLMSEYQISKAYFQAIKLKENDKVIAVEYDKEETTMLFISESGMTLRFNKEEVPVQNRLSMGVMAINIADNDNVIYGGQVGKIGAITVVTDKCFAKKVPVGVFDISPRYRKGLRILTWKNNGQKLIFANFASVSAPIVVMDSKAKVIEPKNVPYDNRVSVGKQVMKKTIKSGFCFFE